jgi:anti-sigma-K factor RskA
MNTQAYIASGILEEYILGTASLQEKQEVECLSKIYPEIKEELGRLEQALESYALEFQTPPPSELKGKIFDQMDFDPAFASPVSAPTAVESQTAERVEESIEPASEVSSARWPRLLAVTSVVLLIVSGWALVEKSRVEREVAVLVRENESLNNAALFQANLTQLYRDPDVKVVRMEGVEKSPESLVIALWNSKTNEVLLDVQSLPDVPSGKQYQLWSMVDGVPIDMGLLEKHFEDKILQMKAAKPAADAFAITLEKEGGNGSPTLSELYVMGNV